MDGSRVAIDFAMRFYMDEEIQSILPDGDRSYARVFEGVQAIQAGAVVAYAIMCGERPVGMFWGSFLNDFCLVAHWGILKRYRTPGLASDVAKVGIPKVFEMFPMLTSIMGFTPKNNLAGVIGARVAGFKEQGILPKSHVDNGKLVDSIIFVRERD